MNICIVQPRYSVDYTESEELFLWQIEAMDKCDSSMDLIVFPESCDIPALAQSQEDFLHSANTYAAPLLKKAAQTAKRCNAVVFINCSDIDAGYRNTTFAFDRNGMLVGKYDKDHLTLGEVTKRKRDSGYSFRFSSPTIITIDGLRYAFLTCYDFYFYEAFANIARNNVDIIIGCSHQRSDTHLALEIMSQFLAYNTNAYVVRSSVSMSEDGDIGGASLVAAPNGAILLNMKNRVGMECVQIDPNAKYFKPAGFGNPPSAHYEYVEEGRHPWKYRPAGSAIVAYDTFMPYPRVCAYRGFHAAAPENSMAAFGAAIAMGAQEIAFDLWYTADGEIVSVADGILERISDGTGAVYEYTYPELLRYDFGSCFSKDFAGLKILRFEEILHKFAGHAIMNIRIEKPHNVKAYSPKYLESILSLIDKYDCRRHVYFVTDDIELMAMLQEKAPDICRCMDGSKKPTIAVEHAILYGCKKIQFVKDCVNRDLIQAAHANGIRCNLLGTDDPEEAQQFLKMGVDTILTNHYYRVERAVNTHQQ